MMKIKNENENKNKNKNKVQTLINSQNSQDSQVTKDIKSVRIKIKPRKNFYIPKENHRNQIKHINHRIDERTVKNMINRIGTRIKLIENPLFQTFKSFKTFQNLTKFTNFTNTPIKNDILSVPENIGKKTLETSNTKDINEINAINAINAINEMDHMDQIDQMNQSQDRIKLSNNTNFKISKNISKNEMHKENEEFKNKFCLFKLKKPNTKENNLQFMQNCKSKEEINSQYKNNPQKVVNYNDNAIPLKKNEFLNSNIGKNPGKYQDEYQDEDENRDEDENQNEFPESPNTFNKLSYEKQKNVICPFKIKKINNNFNFNFDFQNNKMTNYNHNHNQNQNNNNNKILFEFNLGMQRPRKDDIINKNFKTVENDDYEEMNPGKNVKKLFEIYNLKQNIKAKQRNNFWDINIIRNKNMKIYQKIYKNKNINKDMNMDKNKNKNKNKTFLNTPHNGKSLEKLLKEIKKEINIKEDSEDEDNLTVIENDCENDYSKIYNCLYNYSPF